MTTDAISEPPRRLRFKRFLTALSIAALLGSYPLWRAARLVADPSSPKDCPPLLPESGGGARTESAKQTSIEIPTSSPLPWAQKGGTVNDASCLNRTPVFGVVQVATVDDVRSALQFARESHLKVSIAGVRHSMGGHAFARSGVVLDMTRFNRMSKGRFFLPYQLHYTPEQLERSYPEIRAFFRAKREIDPDRLLTSTFYEKYSPALGEGGQSR